jgi:nitroreductase
MRLPLRDIIALALRTPDHGKLAPWRIVTVADDQRARSLRCSNRHG